MIRMIDGLNDVQKHGINDRINEFRKILGPALGEWVAVQDLSNEGLLHDDRWRKGSTIKISMTGTQAMYGGEWSFSPDAAMSVRGDWLYVSLPEGYMYNLYQFRISMITNVFVRNAFATNA